MKEISVQTLPQAVPSTACVTCSVCCRFPEADSVLRPYFTPAEIERAVAGGLDRRYFSDPNGSQITLVPNLGGDGFLCPAFDSGTGLCRIYPVRPFDCQIYPLAVMWSEDHHEVLLGWDVKCPFIAAGRGGESDGRGLSPHDAQAYAGRMGRMLEADEHVERIAAHPGLIGPYQDDVLVLRRLTRLSERLRVHPSEGLASLTVADRPAFEAVVRGARTPLSSYAFPPHYVWRSLFRYAWTTLAGHVCVFAEDADGLFMPLPPLPSGDGASLAAAVRGSFAVMQQRNGASGITRIEGITEELKPAFEKLGCRIGSKDPDYLYRADVLSTLAGDRFKAQRHACNRFVREHQCRLEPYQLDQRDACLALYRRWAAQQEARGLDGVGREMLTDAAAAHAVGLAEAEALGLVGLVVFVEGSLCAYTLGYGLPGLRHDPVFCVLFEVADRSVPGLASFLFRETCRTAAEQGYVWVNTMDDAGLPGLARSKQAYHPTQLIAQYIARPERC